MKPSTIDVGGGVLGADPKWFNPVRVAVLARIRHTVAIGLEVVPATLGSDAGVIVAGPKESDGVLA